MIKLHRIFWLSWAIPFTQIESYFSSGYDKYADNKQLA